jgi:hypothetical protein
VIRSRDADVGVNYSNVGYLSGTMSSFRVAAVFNTYDALVRYKGYLLRETYRLKRTQLLLRSVNSAGRGGNSANVGCFGDFRSNARLAG